MSLCGEDLSNYGYLGMEGNKFWDCIDELDMFSK